MNNRLLHIALAQVIALVLFGFYVKHLHNRMEFAEKRGGATGFNLGVAVMTLQINTAGSSETDDQLHTLSEAHKNLLMKDPIWNGLPDHLALGILAAPAGALGFLAAATILLEARSRRFSANIAGKEPSPRREPVDF